MDFIVLPKLFIPHAIRPPNKDSAVTASAHNERLVAREAQNRVRMPVGGWLDGVALLDIVVIVAYQ